MAEDERSETEVTGPGGWGLKFRGSNQIMLIVIIMLLVSGALGFGLWQHEVAAAGRAVKTVERDAAAAAGVKELSAAVDKQEKKMDAMIFVLTLDDRERKALRLDKPQVLRDMQR